MNIIKKHFRRLAYSLIACGGVALMPKSAAYAKGAAQQARFQVWFDGLKPILNSSSDPQKVAQALLQNKTRSQVFYLEGLGRLYRDQDDDFTQLLTHVKALEDRLGKVDESRSIALYAKEQASPPAEQQRVQAEWQAAATALVQTLHADEWVTEVGSARLDQLQSLVDHYDWPSYEKDRAFVLQRLIHEAKEIRKTDYDMDVLQSKNGLHDLRRDLRWITIEMRALNGLVTFADNANHCPVAAYQDLLKDPKAVHNPFAQLPRAATEVAPCYISRCLFIAASTIINTLGEIKDLGEQIGLGLSDVTPPEKSPQAWQLYRQMQDNQLLHHLEQQLQVCM